MLYATLLCIPQVTNGDPTPTPPAVGTLCVPTVGDPAVVRGGRSPSPFSVVEKRMGSRGAFPPFQRRLSFSSSFSPSLSHRKPPFPPLPSKTATGSQTSLPPRRPLLLPPFRHPQRPLGGYKGEKDPFVSTPFHPPTSPRPNPLGFRDSRRGFSDW